LWKKVTEVESTYCLVFTSLCLSSSEWAAWVQAFGSITAIVGAWIVARRQAQMQFRNDFRLQELQHRRSVLLRARQLDYLTWDLLMLEPSERPKLGTEQDILRDFLTERLRDKVAEYKRRLEDFRDGQLDGVLAGNLLHSLIDLTEGLHRTVVDMHISLVDEELKDANEYVRHAMDLPGRFSSIKAVYKQLVDWIQAEQLTLNEKR
jgi:hypothetical protein